jgi:hypothetical protein
VVSFALITVASIDTTGLNFQARGVLTSLVSIMISRLNDLEQFVSL